MNQYKSYYSTILRILLPAVIVFIAIGFLYEKTMLEEFPALKREDALNDYVLSSKMITGDHAWVILKPNKKFRIVRSINNGYQDHPSLARLLSPGDIIMKKKFSDTIMVKRFKGVNGIRNEYLFVMGQTIEKK